MAYRLLSNSKDVLRGSFESFLIHIPFTVEASSRRVTIDDRGCVFAVYGSYESGCESRPNPSPAEADEEKLYSFELEGSNASKLGLSSLEFRHTRRSVYSNESHELHVFRFKNDGTNGEAPGGWIKDGGWSVRHENRKRNESGTPFLRQAVASFGSCSDRECFWVMSEDGPSGTSQLGVALPFLRGSLLSNVLGLGKEKAIPKLEIKQRDDVYRAFVDPINAVDGTVFGSVVVAAGSFRQLSLNDDLEALDASGHGGNEAVKTSSNLLERIAERRSSLQRGRTLQQVAVSDRTTLVPGDNSTPTEVLYVRLQPDNPVERLNNFR